MRDESGDAIIARHFRNLAFDLNNGMSEKDALERMRERFNAEVDDDKIPFLTHRDRHFHELENRLKTATKNLKKTLFATDNAEGNALTLSGVKVSERATVDCLPGMMYLQLDGWDICYLPAWRNFKTAAEGFLQDKIGKCLLQGKGHAADQLRCAIAYIRHATVTTCHDRDDFRDSFIYALWLDREATAEMNGETIDLTQKPAKPASVSNEDLMQMMREMKEEAHDAKVAAEQAKDTAEGTQTIVKAHLPPRPADYQVTQDQLSGMLKAKNCPKTVKQIQRWEKYLQTGGTGKDVTQPPKGYTLQTRLTLQTATAWVDSYAAQDIGKLKTKISFEERYGGRT